MEIAARNSNKHNNQTVRRFTTRQQNGHGLPPPTIQGWSVKRYSCLFYVLQHGRSTSSQSLHPPRIPHHPLRRHPQPWLPHSPLNHPRLLPHWHPNHLLLLVPCPIGVATTNANFPIIIVKCGGIPKQFSSH